MNLTERILKHLETRNEAIVDFREVENEMLFLEENELNNMNSLMLVVGGHRPETEFRLSKDKIINWSKENNLEYFHNELDRQYHFRKLK